MNAQDSFLPYGKNIQRRKNVTQTFISFFFPLRLGVGGKAVWGF
jgi:hypothetical protein